MQNPSNIGVNGSPALGVLLNVSRNVVGTLDLQKILQEAVVGVSSLFDWGTAAIYLLEDVDHIKLYATHPGLPPDFPDVLRTFNFDEHPHLAKAIRTAQPVLIPDTENATLSEGERIATLQRRLRTVFYVPLVSEDAVLGAFIVGSSNLMANITDEETKLAISLANFAALAIRNARLFEEKCAYTAELERTVAQRDEAEAERKKLQSELFQVQKLDAIGQLAGGVAHDFNNQLSGILGYAELLRNNLADGELAEFASQIVTLAQRSAELNSKLLAFARKGQAQSVSLDLHQVIAEVCGILSHTISPQIEIRTVLEAPACITKGDPTQIQSALLNLAINARDAMPKGGKLSFETQDVPRIDKETNLGPFLLRPGDYVRITVRDSGVGMTAEIMERMYEPFFTTKKEGKGTGMGLPAVFGTMKSLGGAIDIVSCPGKGSAFHLFFPLVRQSASTGVHDDGFDGNRTSTGQVLVIDDEEFIADVACEHLRQAGYSPRSFTSACEAIDFFRGEHTAISVVLLDMAMPKISGSDAFIELRKIAPEVAVILMSGYADVKELQSLLDAGARGFLQKPFRRKELLDCIRDILS